MPRPSLGRIVKCFAVVLVALIAIPSARAQFTQGRVDVTVYDQKGAVVPGAKLELQDLATNDVRTAVTESTGTYSFVNLSLGKYKLKVSKDGFQTAAYDVIVESTKVTTIEATLQVGSVTQVIEVGAAAPVVDTTSNAIGSVISMKQIENLPLTGRNLNQLSTLTPGYTGTWNGLPSIALGSNVDGIQQGPTRMKFGGIQVSVQARLESIEEMTIQTDQLDVNQGFGQASMQINFTTRRGSNDLHGRLFEDFRNSALNANSWRNNASGVAKPHFELNDFGGAIGGPILKDKLFFFGSFANARQPGSSSVSATFLTAAAQTGNFTYASTAASSGGAVCNGTTCTVNLFAAAQNYNTANGTSLPTTTNSTIGAQFTRINNSLQFGTVTTTSDPVINSINWLTPNPTTNWYPTVRVDYNLNTKIRMNLAWNRTVTISPTTNTPYFPGSDFTNTGVGNRFNAYTASYGLDWTISPRLINQFRGGFLYNANFFGYNSPQLFVQNPVNVNWPLGLTTPMNFYLPVISYYPVFNASDTLTWQKGTHSFSFGFSFYREQDHYWNPPEIAHVNLGLASGDPALTAMTPGGGSGSISMPGSTTAQQAEAQSLYALLTGRITSVNQSYPLDPKTGQYIQKPALHYDLNELSKAWSVFFQDAFRIRPSLTINYGLRWDFTGDDHDQTSAYHNADLSSLFGPSGVGNLFKPGVLTGNLNPTLDTRPHAYNSWNKAPQPVFGIAWSPHFENGFLRKIAGRDDTVIRASFALRKFTVPYQYFWNNASDYGSFFYQFGTLQAVHTSTPTTGFFDPGTLAVGQTLPAYALNPATYTQSAPESAYTFINSPPVNGMNQNIAQPYTETWTLGIQRRLGASRAVEIRYNGNRTLKQWISLNLNEVNVFENGFLQEFKNAQNNMAICKAQSTACLAAQAAAGIASAQQTTSNFANWGLTGQVALPILTTAFTGTSAQTLTPGGTQANSNFRGAGTSFITQLNTGAVGAMALQLTRLGGTPYFCNLVGPTFTPCVTNVGYTGGSNGPGGGYPINFFQANPYATGSGVGYMDSAGYSSYNSLQVDFRQRTWHGLEFDANYTWSHTLGVATPNDWTGAYPAFTLRNLRASYGPTLFDLRHVVHITGTYDLPFGKGKQFANQSALADRVIGGWSIGTILTYQSGFPFRLLGSRSTNFNNIANSGVNLTGVTPEQLQSVIGVYRVPGRNFVTLLPPNYLVSATGGGANPSVFSDNTVPGTFVPPIYLHGPHGFYDNIMISKSIPITERWRFTFQAELLNAFNHPVFGNGTTPIGANILSTSFATTSSGASGSFGRQIELRANISF
jgi:hypothetical protein